MHHHFICTVFMQSNTLASVMAVDDYKSTVSLLLCTANVWGWIFIQWASMSSLLLLTTSLGFWTVSYHHWAFLSWNLIFFKFCRHGLSKEGRYCRMCCTDMVVLGVWGLLEQTVRGELQAVSGGEPGAVTHWAKGHAQCDWVVGAGIGHKLAIF